MIKILLHPKKSQISYTLSSYRRGAKPLCPPQYASDLMSFINKPVQTDVAVLDFKKLFDTVPHNRLLSKLAYYGIDKNIWQCISTFLKGRKQSVIVDGKSSLFADVDSGVLQGTVLSRLLFLLHINNLPSVLNSKDGLFADDYLIYIWVKSILIL